jgi:hypothetical protein
MAQGQPISRDRNFVATSLRGRPRLPGPVPPTSSATPSRPRQPISQDRDYMSPVATRDPARVPRRPTVMRAGPGDPNYQFPADIKQGVGRFASEALRGSGLHPSDLRAAFDEAISNPALALDIVSGLAQGAKDQLWKSWESLKTNRPADALKHLTYAAIPGIGPALDQATEDFQRGDTAGSLGRITGIFASLGIGSVRPGRQLGVDVRPPFRNPNPVQREAVEYAARQDIPVDLATASGNRALRSIQEGLEYTPGGMAVEMAKGPPRVQALRRSAQQLADDVSPAPISPEAWGTAARDRVTQARDRYTAIADEAYPEFRAAATASGELVDITAVLESAPMQELWRRLTQKREAAQGLVGRELRAYLKIGDLRALPPGLADIGVIDDILGDLKSYARTERGPIKVVVGALEKQVQAATKLAGPEAVEALTRGRQAIRDRVRVDAVLDTFADEPVRVFNRYVTAGGTNIEGLRELVKIDKKLGPELGRAWLERNLDPVLSGGGFEKAQRFRSSYNKLDTNTKEIIFGGAENVKAMDNFTQLTEQMGKLANPPGTAGQLIGVGALTTAAAYFRESFPGYAILSLLTPGVLSAVFKSPTAVRALTQGLSMAAGPGRGTSAASMAAQASALELVRAAVRESGQPLAPAPVYNPDTTPRGSALLPADLTRRY